MSRSHHLLTLCLATALPLTASAQKPVDNAPPIPTQSNLPADTALNPALPTLFIVGDSTARNGANLGWADHLAPLFDTTRINIANRSVAGRSSRTYFNEGRWDKVVAELKPGDVVLIQMGHNDGGSNATTILNDPKARGSIHSLGDETAELTLPNKPAETIHTYGWYIRRYIADVRAKQATPILLTLTIRNIWTPGPDGKPHIERDMGFRDFETKLATTENVPLADMAALEANYLETLGPEKTAALFPIDHTHTSAAGADLNAHFVADALRSTHLPVAAFLQK